MNELNKMLVTKSELKVFVCLFNMKASELQVSGKCQALLQKAGLSDSFCFCSRRADQSLQSALIVFIQHL